jgi:hypothetical protein
LKNQRKLSTRKEIVLKNKLTAIIRLAIKLRLQELVERSCRSVVKWHQQNQTQQRASSVQKSSTRIGYNVFVVVVGLMKTAPVLREIFYTTHVISAKYITIYDD